MDWPTDREAEGRDQEHTITIEGEKYVKVGSDNKSDYYQLAQQVRDKQKRRNKGVGQEFEVKDEFFD